MIKKLISYKKKLLNRETILYGIFGSITTLLNIELYQILLYLGVEYKNANLITLIVVKSMAYIVNKFFVFNSKTESFNDLVKEIWRFTVTRGATMLLDYFGLILLVEVFDFNKSISKYITTVLVVIINYFLSKKHVFVSNKKNGEEKIDIIENDDNINDNGIISICNKF